MNHSFFVETFYHFNDLFFVLLMLLGLYITAEAEHMIKKVAGLSIFQSAIFIFYVGMGKVIGGTAPILDHRFSIYSNPLPQVLILTAIVVSIATTAVAFAFCVRLRKSFGNVYENDISRELRKQYIEENSSSLIYLTLLREPREYKK